MTDKIIIYSKQSGESPVPVTVRINWLPTGIIKPQMYWTPDGTCYNIISNLENTALAFLHERGEGLRYKVRSEIIDTSEPYSELLHSHYETYLYLSDRRFCERNIIDERYSHTGKEYVTVMLDVFPDGDYEIICFWVNGLRYKVERTYEVEPRGNFQAGGTGIWHKVDVRLVNEVDDEDPDPKKSVCRLASLYLELNKWFVVKAI